MYVVTKWCKTITDSGKDEYTHKPHEGLPFKFRCLDDDGDVYFYGYASSCDDEEAFTPLDETGAEHGCTSIEYRNEKGDGKNCKGIDWRIAQNNIIKFVQSAYRQAGKDMIYFRYSKERSEHK